MKVNELIEILDKKDPDVTVYVNGRDISQINESTNIDNDTHSQVSIDMDETMHRIKSD